MSQSYRMSQKTAGVLGSQFLCIREGSCCVKGELAFLSRRVCLSVGEKRAIEASSKTLFLLRPGSLCSWTVPGALLSAGLWSGCGFLGPRGQVLCQVWLGVGRGRDEGGGKEDEGKRGGKMSPFKNSTFNLERYFLKLLILLRLSYMMSDS